MLKRHGWFVLPLAVLLASCQDASRLTSPTAGTTRSQRVAMSDAFSLWGDSTIHILRQGPTAPPLETYQVSFWVRRDRETSVTVNYQPAPGRTTGQPFIWFDVPKDALFRNPDGEGFKGKDSVLITMTVDTVRFIVDFEPSGLQFKHDHEPMLVVWDQNANQDLNGDGVVDAADDSLLQQLRIITRSGKHEKWHWTRSFEGWDLPYVFAPLQHFSQYAVSW